jgi:hypothetical protein
VFVSDEASSSGDATNTTQVLTGDTTSGLRAELYDNLPGTASTRYFDNRPDSRAQV